MTHANIIRRCAASLLVLSAAVAIAAPASAQGYGWNYDRGLGWGTRYSMRYDVPPGYYTGAGAPVYAAALDYGYSPYSFRTAYGCLPYNRHCPW
jgi:hypothetical protein